MSTIKSGHISLYCNFHKIIKVPATSFQSPALSHSVFPHAEPSEIVFDKLTRKLRKSIFKNILSTLCTEVGRLQEKLLFCISICSGDTQ